MRKKMVEHMSQYRDFLSHSDLKPYFNSSMRVLLGESDRGALLIGVSQIDETLQLLFEKLAPTSVPNKRKKEIFGFSGPFGSLSSKLDVALVCRVLPENLIEAINKIRKIRNKLAHKMESFELADHNKELSEILSLVGPNADTGINKLSTDVMMSLYVDQLCELKHDDGTMIFENQGDAIRHIAENSEVLAILKRQQPKWTYAIAVGVICGLIVLHRDEICDAMESCPTLFSLISK